MIWKSCHCGSKTVKNTLNTLITTISRFFKGVSPVHDMDVLSLSSFCSCSSCSSSSSSFLASSYRFYQVLYQCLQDPLFGTAAGTTAFLNLVYKALSSDTSDPRTLAFCKRLLQVCVCYFVFSHFYFCYFLFFCSINHHHHLLSPRSSPLLFPSLSFFVFLLLSLVSFLFCSTQIIIITPFLLFPSLSYISPRSYMFVDL